MMFCSCVRLAFKWFAFPNVTLSGFLLARCTCFNLANWTGSRFQGCLSLSATFWTLLTREASTGITFQASLPWKCETKLIQCVAFTQLTFRLEMRKAVEAAPCQVMKSNANDNQFRQIFVIKGNWSTAALTMLAAVQTPLSACQKFIAQPALLFILLPSPLTFDRLKG